MKKFFQVLFLLAPLLAAPVKAGVSDIASVPALFRNAIPVEFRDGLKVVEIRKRCEACSPWRFVDYYDNNRPEKVKQEKVSVQDGYTAMYAFPGTDYFANGKIEQSVPGHYADDRAVVTDALKHECTRKKEHVDAYLRDNQKAKEKVDALIPAGKDYIDFEQASYREFDYVSCTENMIGLTGPGISQVHIFVPRSDLIITAYLLNQKNPKFKNIDEFLQMRKDFIAGYIDFLSGK